jgi:spore germination protein YaaH
MFRIDPKPRSFSAPTPEGPSRHLSGRQFSLLAGVILVLIAAIGVVSQRGSTQPAQANLVSTILPASDAMPIATGTGGNDSVDGELGGDSSSALAPAVAGAATTPTPASLAGQPPLRSHEVFGFAPYWTLAASSGFDLSGLTTVDYFGVDVNPDGSLDTSDAGAQGFQSQNFVDLVNRAHAAGDRVVVTVDDFSQSSLDQLALSTTAPQTLANSVLFLVKSRGLDGINLDLEGAGSGDQSGITSLVKTVSQTLKAVSPNSQVTMDTYASSAGDPNGFYDIPALSPFVDGFFVMAYQLNLRSTPSGQSPITSSMFSNQTTVNEYANAVPANKVILGLPFFGYDWPTTNGTMAAQPAGAPTVVTYAQEAASGHPIYWDPVTETAWTSYQVGSQWHEAFFENPNSLSVATQLARQNGIAGVGIWALGMDGPNDQAMVSALNGQALSTASMSTGPSTTSTSPAAPEVAPLVKSAAPRAQASTTTTTPNTTRTEPADP